MTLTTPETYLRQFTWDEGEAPGELGLTPRKDKFTATAGQTLFNLTNTVNPLFPPFVYMNFVTYPVGGDSIYQWSLSGQVLSFNTAFSAGDVVTVVYWS